MKHNSPQPANSPSSPKRGVALILMLGVLALLALMAVAFSGTMRMERSAAGNSRQALAARELLYVGLSRALEQIDTDVGTLGYSPWSNDVYASIGSMADSAPNLLASEATNYIPGALSSSAAGVTPGWISIYDPGGGGTNGHVAFMIIDTSGLLDAGVVGGGTNRLLGTNVNEIVLDDLSEMFDVDDFYWARTNLQHFRYETLDELAQLQNGYGLQGWVTNLFTYSRLLHGYLDPNTLTAQTNMVNISGVATNLELKEFEIRQAFLDSITPTPSPGDAAFLYSNLLDYVDADSEPRNLGSALTEPVPMINEVQAQTFVFYDPVLFGGAGDPNKATTILRVSFEWLYPFVAPTTNSFDVSYQIFVEPFTKVTSITRSNELLFLPASATNIVSSGYSGQSRWYDVVDVITTNANNSYIPTGYPRTPVKYDMQIRVDVRDSTGAIVDSVPFPSNGTPIAFTTAELNVPTSPVQFAALAFVSVTNGVECRDPRYNWDPALTGGQWFDYGIMPPAGTYVGSIYQGPAALSVANAITRTNITSSLTDGHTDMYVANRPLRQVGELSYLVRSASVSFGAWQTLRLMSQRGQVDFFPADSFLDHFTLLPPKRVRRGFVNPNTRQREVLGAVFYKLPLDDYPGHGVNQLNWNGATNLADAFISTRDTTFQNLSDIGNHTNFLDHAVFAGKTDFQKEALLRNAAGLYGTRQNIYTILLAGQTVRHASNQRVWVDDTAVGWGPGASAGWITTVESDQRAVAVVWRDPYPDADGKHAYLIREFKLLSR